jgi:hypothetical protein
MTNVEGRRPEGAPERSPKAGEGAASGVDGKVARRFSVQRKMAIVARLLRGEPLSTPRSRMVSVSVIILASRC